MSTQTETAEEQEVVTVVNGWRAVSEKDDLISWRKDELCLVLMTIDGLEWQLEIGFIMEDYQNSQIIWRGTDFAAGIQKATNIIAVV